MAENKEEYFQARDIYLVNISIIRAINLPKADTFGKSDGFVKVECLNRKFRTITVKKDLNPKWDAKAYFQFFRKPMQIKFRVLDWNAPPQKDAPLGNYILDIRDDWWLRDSPGLPKTIVKMQNCKRGEIEIGVTCQKLEPFGYLDKMRRCAELKIQYKNDLDKCEQNIKNCNQEYQQNQQACAAYEQKCNQLQEECTNKNGEKNTYEEQGRKYDSQMNDLNSEVTTCDNKYNSLLKEYKDKDFDCDKIIKQYNTTKKQCEQLINAKQELEIQYKQKKDAYEQQQAYILQQQQQEQEQQEQNNEYNNYDNENDDNNDFDDEKRELYSKIRENEINIGKYDDELCNNIIEKYKDCFDRQVSGVSDDDGSDDDNNNARIEGNKYLSKIKQWAHGCNEQAYSSLLNALGPDGDLNYNNSDQKQFVIKFCKQLNSFFFCLQIIDSTLIYFQDEILKLTKKKNIKQVTFNDLAGTTDTKDDSYDDEEDEPSQPTTVWNTLYEDFNFVIDELGDIFTPYMKTISLQTMCKLQSEFILSCYDGNYYKFTKLIAHYMLQYSTDYDNNILNENDDPNGLLDDGITNTILILNDKKQFLYKLYQSITNAPKSRDDNDEENEYDDNDQQDNTYEAGKFEMIAAAIIVLVGQLDSVILDPSTKPNKDEQEKINAQRDVALDDCENYGIDDRKSLDLIKKFFSYFFVPEGGGGPCNCSGDGGGFFGTLFGSICK